MGGWLEIWGLKLISTQVEVEVEVGIELGKKFELIAEAKKQSISWDSCPFANYIGTFLYPVSQTFIMNHKTLVNICFVNSLAT